MRSQTRQAVYALKRYHELRARGLCTRCTGATREGRSMCAGCASYDYELKVTTERRRNLAGLCICGKEPRRPNRTLGERCAEKQKRSHACRSR
jgi:hypothetical protein